MKKILFLMVMFVFVASPAIADMPVPLTEQERTAAELISRAEFVYVYPVDSITTLPFRGQIVSLDELPSQNIIKDILFDKIQVLEASHRIILSPPDSETISSQNAFAIPFRLKAKAFSLEEGNILIGSLAFFPKFYCNKCSEEQEVLMQGYLSKKIIPLMWGTPFLLSDDLETDLVEVTSGNAGPMYTKKYKLREIHKSFAETATRQIDQILDLSTKGILTPSF